MVGGHTGHSAIAHPFQGADIRLSILSPASPTKLVLLLRVLLLPKCQDTRLQLAASIPSLIYQLYPHTELHFPSPSERFSPYWNSLGLQDLYSTVPLSGTRNFPLIILETLG